MPELPEVETIARQLEPMLKGKRIIKFTALDPKLGHLDAALIQGKTIRRIYRLGKEVAIELEGAGKTKPSMIALIHLRMTGKLIFSDSTGRLDKKHLRAVFKLDKGRLLFYDTRRFGLIRFFTNPQEARQAGVDPMSKDFSPKLLKNTISGSRQQIKTWLMRQDKLTGLGNIYASEILFAARISPFRPADSLSDKEIKKLYQAIRSVLKQAIQCCGTTFSDYRDARGLIGSFQNRLKVYGRAGELCKTCGKPVQKTVQGQRSTYFCGTCQKG